MYYKEFLRIRHFFTVFAIVLTGIALLTVLLSGHAKVNVSDDRPAATAAAYEGSSGVHGFSSSTQVQGPGIVISDDAHTPFPFSAIFAIAGLVAAIFATGVGTVLACENAHLDLAWTRPASRVRYATYLVLVDVAGIVAIYAFTVLLSVAVIYGAGWQHHVVIDGRSVSVLEQYVLFPLAWYGVVFALTASVRGRTSAIAGFSWLGAVILVMLLNVSLPPALHALIVGLNYLNPLVYGSYSTGAEAARHILQVSLPMSLVGLAGITALGVSAGLVQWRRLEA